MAQHDYIIDNQTFPGFRADLNNALNAIATSNSGSSEPLVTYPNQIWADTTANLLKIRNTGNTAWVILGALNSANLGLLNDANLTGISQAQTVLATDNSGRIATTAFCKNSVVMFKAALPSASTFSISCALGSANYRYGQLKFSFNTVGFSKQAAILTSRLRLDPSANLREWVGAIAPTPYLDNSTEEGTIYLNDGYTGTLSFSLIISVNCANTTDVYILSSIVLEAMFFA
jgi:hypothetical protein